MNAPERNPAAPIDPVKLDRLAEVAIKVGLRLERGQNLLVTAPTVALPLVRKVAEYAYKAAACRYSERANGPERPAVCPDSTQGGRIVTEPAKESLKDCY